MFGLPWILDIDVTVRLSGWTRDRRVVLVRESPARVPVSRIGKPRRGKDRRNFLPKTRGAGWYAQATPWSGKISAIVTSLDPNEGHHREAIRTRPMLMAGVGHQVRSGGQRTVKVSILHEKGDVIAKADT